MPPLIPPNYPGRPLLEKDMVADPFAQFASWYDEATEVGILTYDVMALGTASPDGKPSIRFVLLKQFDEKGFVFYTNYESRKGKELEANPWASLAFYWYELFRQVRIEGRVEKASAQESDEDFRNRPIEAQLAIWATRQSETIDDRTVFERHLQNLRMRFRDHVPRPAHWGGFRLRPEVFEFWQGHPDMLHDRILYRLHQDGNWRIGRLSP